MHLNICKFKVKTQKFLPEYEEHIMHSIAKWLHNTEELEADELANHRIYLVLTCIEKG